MNHLLFFPVVFCNGECGMKIGRFDHKDHLSKNEPSHYISQLKCCHGIYQVINMSLFLCFTVMASFLQSYCLKCMSVNCI